MIAKFDSFNDLPLTLTSDDIAAVLSISRASAYQLLHRQDFPVLTIGGRLLVPKDKFIEWISQHTRTVEVTEIA